MQATRLTGIILLSLALVLGATTIFLATGEAHVTYSDSALGERIEAEEYSFWSLEQEETTFAGVESEETSGWFNANLDDTGGITYLRAAPVLLALGLVFVIAALVLAAITRTSYGIISGVMGAIGFADMVAAGFFHVAGVALRAEFVFGRPDAVMAQFSVYLYMVMCILVLVAALLLMKRTEPIYVEEEAGDESYFDESFAETISETGMQRLMCPDCNHVEVAPFGSIPTCSNCGFSGRQSF